MCVLVAGTGVEGFTPPSPPENRKISYFKCRIKYACLKKNPNSIRFLFLPRIFLVRPPLVYGENCSEMGSRETDDVLRFFSVFRGVLGEFTHHDFSTEGITKNVRPTSNASLY